MKVALIIILIILALILGPAMFLWAVNTLADAGGSDFYIPHGFWTYLASLALAMFIGGSSKSGK
jgi:hypothetical protein